MEMGEPIRSLFQSPVNPGPRLWAPTCLILILSTFASGQSLEKPTLFLGEALVHPLEETRLSLQCLTVFTWRLRAMYHGKEVLKTEGPEALKRLPSLMEAVFEIW